MSQQCQTCAGRAELYLCAPCTDQLRNQLTALLTGPIVGARPDGQPIRTSGLLEDLNDVVLRRTRLGGDNARNTRNDENPALYMPDTENDRATKQAEATTALGAINTTLATIIDATHTHGGINGWRPDRTTPASFIGPLLPGWRRLPTNYRPTNTDMTTWLTAHILAIANHEKAGQWHDAITALTNHIERVIDRPVGRKFLGKCPTWDDQTRTVCGRELNAPEDAIEVYCRKCRRSHNCDRLQLLLVNDLARKKLTAEQIRQYQRRYLPPEFRVSERTLRHWIQHGRLKPRGWQRPDGSHGINQRNANDEPLYLWRDVEKLRAERPKKVGTQ